MTYEYKALTTEELHANMQNFLRKINIANEIHEDVLIEAEASMIRSLSVRIENEGPKIDEWYEFEDIPTTFTAFLEKYGQ